MSEYLLKRFEIQLICDGNFNTRVYPNIFRFKETYTHNVPGHWVEHEKLVRSQEANWASKFFNLLLASQPELKPLVDNFWEGTLKEKYIDFYAGELFDKKIQLKSIYPLFFTMEFLNGSTREATDFIKKMVKEYPPLMDELHRALKTEIKDYTLKAYIELLPKYIKEIKNYTDEETQNNIRRVLVHADNYSESYQIKVLKSAVKVLSHTKITYDFLTKYLNPKFDHNHNLRTEFNTVEKKYFSQFKPEDKIDFFPNSSEYRYVLSVKDANLMDFFGIHKFIVANTNKALCGAIEEILKEHLNIEIAINYTGRGLEISTPSVDNKPILDKQMEEIKECMIHVMSSLSPNEKKSPTKESFKDKLTKCLLKFKLDDTLSIQETVRKIKKI